MTDPPPTLDPRRTALLVMDFQRGILGRLENPTALLDRAVDATAQVRDAGGHIGYVRVAFADEDYAGIPASSRMGAMVASAGRAFHADELATAVHERIAPQGGDIVVRKTRVGAFSTTDLEQQLRDREVDTLILAGISTSGVVLSTVRDAHDRDYRLFVLADVSADPEPGVHEFLTERIFPSQAHVIELAELPGLLSGAAAGS
jgi:nicotinamidase-related amidase